MNRPRETIGNWRQFLENEWLWPTSNCWKGIWAGNEVKSPARKVRNFHCKSKFYANSRDFTQILGKHKFFVYFARFAFLIWLLALVTISNCLTRHKVCPFQFWCFSCGPMSKLDNGGRKNKHAKEARRMKRPKGSNIRTVNKCPKAPSCLWKPWDANAMKARTCLQSPLSMFPQAAAVRMHEKCLLQVQPILQT